MADDAPCRVLLIDSYDSYTYNLYQGLAEVAGVLATVIRNDEIAWEALSEQLQAGEYDAVVLSPGPGTPDHPRDIGVVGPLLAARLDVPMLGVCLGMQAIAHEFGGAVRRAAHGAMHGRLSSVRHAGGPLFRGIPSGGEWRVVRYHSLEVVDLPECLEPLAWARAPPDEALMALKHRELPYWGVQFHPESICTSWGPALLYNFIVMACEHRGLPAPRAPGACLQGPPGMVPGPRSQSPTAVPGLGECSSAAAAGPAAAPALELEHVRLAGTSLQGVGGAEVMFDRLFRRQPYSWWLDSALQDRGGRWHFMGGGVGGRLWRAVQYAGGGALSCTVPGPQGEGPATTTTAVAGFWEWLEADLAAHGAAECRGAGLHQRQPHPCAAVHGAPPASPPFEFGGGWVCALGYELGLELEGLGTGGPRAGDDLPLASLIWADRFVACDGFTGDVFVAALHPSGAADARADACAWLEAQRRAIEELAEASARLARAEPIAPPATAPGPGADELAGFRPREGHASYVDNIGACLDEMLSGESYELCLTTQLVREGEPVPAWPLYQTLRAINPAPYAAWLDLSAMDGPQICCSSPERFLRCTREGILEAKPIKGTAPRFPQDPAKDKASADELQASDKERAENLMIVDLLRNDLGRVCDVGSVAVPHLMALESFASVHQLVSTVVGRRREAASTVDCLRASFPGGSMTGAPKIRSMEILRRLEGGPRGIYSGCIGYISPSGAFDLNIVIRTAVLQKRRMSIGAGGAITVQSDPEAEWEEMRLKARALLRAVRMVESGAGAGAT